MSRLEPLFLPEHWLKPTREELLGYYEDFGVEKKGTGGGLGFRKHLHPLPLYLYLNARFGPPNGMQTRFRKQHDSDNLVHWDYLIKAGPFWLCIQGIHREVQIFTNTKLRPLDWKKFADTLKADFGNHSQKYGPLKSNLEEWQVFTNRYSLISDAAAEQHAILCDVELTPNLSPPKKSSIRDINRYKRSLEDLSQRGAKAFHASLILDLLTPILAESYINLLIFILAKDEVRKNKRRYESFIRQPIDIRVLELHLKCEHFAKPVEERSEEYVAFKKVMDRRNDRIHGNISESKDYMEKVYFDQKFIPIYPESNDALLRTYEEFEKMFDIEGSLNRYLQTHNFLIYLKRCLKKGLDIEIDNLSERSKIGRDNRRGKFSSLFPRVRTH